MLLSSSLLHESSVLGTSGKRCVITWLVAHKWSGEWLVTDQTQQTFLDLHKTNRQSWWIRLDDVILDMTRSNPDWDKWPQALSTEQCHAENPFNRMSIHIYGTEADSHPKWTLINLHKHRTQLDIYSGSLLWPFIWDYIIMQIRLSHSIYCMHAWENLNCCGFVESDSVHLPSDNGCFHIGSYCSNDIHPTWQPLCAVLLPYNKLHGGLYSLVSNFKVTHFYSEWQTLPSSIGVWMSYYGITCSHPYLGPPAKFHIKKGHICCESPN